MPVVNNKNSASGLPLCRYEVKLNKIEIFLYWYQKRLRGSKESSGGTDDHFAIYSLLFDLAIYSYMYLYKRWLVLTAQ